MNAQAHRARRGGIVGVALLLARCSAPVPRPPSAPALRPSPVEAPSEVVLVPREGILNGRVPAAPPYVWHGLWGGLRLSATGDAVEVSQEHFTEQVHGAVPLDHGWAFVTEDGVVAVSETFTGPLRRLGHVQLPTDLPVALHQRPPWATVPPFLRGRVVVLDREGTLWSSEGMEALGPQRGLPVPAHDAAFLDASRGAVVTRYGALLHTQDGGASWRPVDLGDGVAAGLVVHAGDLFAVTTAGTRPLDRAGVLGPPTAPPPPEEPLAPLDPEARERVVEAMLARHPALLTLETTLRARDGARLAAEGRDLVARDAATGRVLRRREGALPDAACDLRGWGEDLAIACPRAPWLLRATETDTVATVARAGEVASDEPRNAEPSAVPLASGVFSDDGLHAAFAGACPSESGASPNDRNTDDVGICALVDGVGRWRSLGVAVVGERPTLVGMHGGLLLVSAASEAPPRGPFRLVDTDTGRGEELALAAPEVARAPVLVAAQWTADGRVAGIALGDAPDAPDEGGDLRGRWPSSVASLSEWPWRARGLRASLALGRPGAPWTLRGLPLGVLALSMADGARGLAVGAHLGAVWRTVDGGRTWTQLTVPVEGAAEAVPSVLPPFHALPSVRCEAGGCSVRGRLVVRGWGPLRRGSVVVLAPPWMVNRGVQARDLAGLFWRTAGGGRPYCEDAGRASPSPWALPSAGREADAGAVWYAGAARVAARGSRRVVTWRAEDDGGSMRGEVVLGAPNPEEAHAVVRGAGRGGLLLDRCREDRTCQLTWLGADGRVAPLPELGEARHRTLLAGTLEAPWNVLSSADGGLLGVLPGYLGGVPVAQYFDLAPSGRMRQRRDVLVPGAERPLGLGLHEGVPGLVTTSEEGRLLFHAASGAASAQPTALPPLPEALGVCEGPRDPRGTELSLAWTEGAPAVCPGGASPTWARVTLALGAGGYCLRHVATTCEAGDGAGSRRTVTVRLTARGPRALEGYTDDGARRTPRRCRW
ncbi:MAG: hypothetical protein HY909_26865 [Deltaproteobacteria bacterium]|nr:hypothetical protein [Deltaproteobacteria bacterium]